MSSLLLARVDALHYLFAIPMTLLSIFLILVILVQRGRGGGLTGALGGMGGQSAFGTKAGDLFTRITIVVAAIWVLLSMASIKVLSQASSTASMDPNQLGLPTATNKSGPGAPGAAAAGKTAEADPGSAAPGATTPGGAPAEPASATGSPGSASPTTAAGDAGAKPADAAKP